MLATVLLVGSVALAAWAALQKNLIGASLGLLSLALLVERI